MNKGIYSSTSWIHSLEVSKKIEAKQIEVDDLPTQTSDIITRAKTMLKELKATKAKLPRVKKPDMPAMQKMLMTMSESYEDSWR